MYPRSANKKTSYKDRKIAAVAGILKRAVTTSNKTGTSFTRGPSGGPRGFYGTYNRPRGLGPELKIIDSGPVADTTAPTMVIVLLNGVAQGTEYNTRQGRHIMMKSLALRFSVNDGATTSVQDMVRCMVVYDKASNGAAAPAGTDILNATAVWHSPLNLSNRERFVVLKEWTFGTPAVVYTAGAVTAGGGPAAVRKLYLPMNKPVIFNTTTAAQGAISSGALYFCYLSRNSNTTSMLYNSRVRFIDP